MTLKDNIGYDMNLLSPRDVERILGISKPALISLRKRDETFPKPIRVGPRTLRWEASTIDAWLQTKKENSSGEVNRSE